MKTTRFARKPFEVDAIRVTEDNMTEVAQWCGGEVREAKSENFIKVNVHRPLNEKQTQAFVGDWVLRAETGFKVYTNRALENSFAEVLVYTEADAEAQLNDTPAPPRPTITVDDDGHVSESPVFDAEDEIAGENPAQDLSVFFNEKKPAVGA